MKAPCRASATTAAATATTATATATAATTAGARLKPTTVWAKIKL